MGEGMLAALSNVVPGSVERVSLGQGSPAKMRALILELEAKMFAMTDHHLTFETTHHFGPGTYMRQLLIPKGTLLTGKIHKTEHLNVLSQGDLSVLTDDGIKRLKASTVVKSMPGIKRVGFAHEDSVWITVHQNPDNETDVAKLEERLIVDTFEQFYLASKRTYADVLVAIGTTHDEVMKTSENTEDQIPFPSEPTTVRIIESAVHGKGVAATRALKNGDLIAPARIDGKRTPVGRYCNHSGSPNAKMVMNEGGDVDLVALEDISGGVEIFVDYYITLNNTRAISQNGGASLCRL